MLKQAIWKTNRGRIVLTQEFLMDMATTNETFKREFIDRLPDDTQYLHLDRDQSTGLFSLVVMCDSYRDIPSDDALPVINDGMSLKPEYAKEKTED